MTSVPDASTRERLARIDAKLDVVIAQQSHLAGLVADHETRLRQLESAQSTVTAVAETVGDHETRLREADKWRFALPITGIGAVIAAAGTIISALKG